MKRNLYKKFILLVMAGILFIPFADAVSLVGTSEESVKEIERRRFETEKKLREKERIEIEQKKIEREKEESLSSQTQNNNKFILKEIIIQNDELLSGREKRKILEPFLNREITFNDLTILVRSITNVLIDKGYITARVKVPLEQNIMSGRFILTIVNGYISEIVPEKDNIRERIQVFTAFPFLEGDYLNIEDLDYGIEQMNRLQSNKATMKIFPGEELGSSKVVIFNDSSSRLGIDAGMDNLGQKSTGENREKVSVNVDDLLSVNDNLFFNYTRSANDDTDRKYSRSYVAFFSIPFGYWTFSSTYSHSEYLQYINGLNRDFKASGNDSSKIFSIDRMLGRYKYNRLKAKGELTLKKKENFIEDAKIDSSSRRLTILKGGLEYSTYLFGGYFSTSGYYHRGLKWFDAYEDTGDLQEDTPRAQFVKYELGVIWSKPFTLFGQKFGYLCNFSGQYGMDTLYNSEKMTIGDIYTVRGFKEESIVGDRGYYIRNEISIYDFSIIWKYLQGLKFFAGYDYGHVVEKAGADANYGEGKGSLSGWSTGIVYSSEIMNLNFTYSRKISSPDFIDEKEHIVYCSATLSLTGVTEKTWNTFVKKDDKEE